MPLPLKLRRLPHGVRLPLPHYASAGAAGLDVVAAEDAMIAPGAWIAVSTGFAVAIPQGYELQVRPRSGLAFKYGVTVLNSPGTIDCDYRGEIKVLLINHGQMPFIVTRGDRVAQLVLATASRVDIVEVSELDQTVRAASGFGSTGV